MSRLYRTKEPTEASRIAKVYTVSIAVDEDGREARVSPDIVEGDYLIVEGERLTSVKAAEFEARYEAEQ